MIKKAQSQIITTVLIILLVLAAVVIVWQVVRSTITEGTSELEGKVGCFEINLEITGANLTHIKVIRNPGGSDDDAINGQIFRDSINTDAVLPNDLDELDTDTIPLISIAGQEIQIAPVLGDDTLCQLTPSETVIDGAI